jgi:hypothetical protein
MGFGSKNWDVIVTYTNTGKQLWNWVIHRNGKHFEVHIENMNVKSNFGEISGGNKKKIVGNRKTSNSDYIVTKNFWLNGVLVFCGRRSRISEFYFCFLFFFFFELHPQPFMLARPVLYCLGHATSSFCFNLFFRDSRLFLGLASNYDPLTYAYDYRHPPPRSACLQRRDGILLTLRPDWSCTVIFQISTSQIPGITSVYHHAKPLKFYLF